MMHFHEKSPSRKSLTESSKIREIIVGILIGEKPLNVELIFIRSSTDFELS